MSRPHHNQFRKVIEPGTLNPCRFCGSHYSALLTHRMSSRVGVHTLVLYCVVCEADSMCAATGPMRPTPELALAAWNGDYGPNDNPLPVI